MQESCRKVVEDSRKNYQELEAELEVVKYELKGMKNEKESFDVSSISKMSTKDIVWQVSKLNEINKKKIVPPKIL